MKLIPASIARRVMRVDSSASVFPPNIIVPRQNRETRRLDEPSVRYSTVVSSMVNGARCLCEIVMDDAMGVQRWVRSAPAKCEMLGKPAILSGRRGIGVGSRGFVLCQRCEGEVW